MLIGYARVSTAEQDAGFEAQERDLKAAGVQRMFSERTSAVGQRKALEEALDFAREGDAIVVTKLDRLARSVADLVRIVERLTKKGVGLRILAMGVDTATPTGKLVLNVLGAIGQFEREVMLERQREGVAKAKAEGKYKGRKPTARAKSDDIIKLAGEGVKREDIAKRLGVGVASVYRALAERRGSASSAPAAPPDALSLALVNNARFKVLPRSGKGFILPAKS
jgi:DNA invertase Pin-like site-specific DNA recombinase